MAMELFPACVDERMGDTELARARRECRISSPDHFEGYFRLDPPSGMVRRTEIEEIYQLLVSKSFDSTRAELVVESISRLSNEERESLERGLADMARGLDVQDAMTLLASLDTLARVRVSAAGALNAAPASSGNDSELATAAPYELFASLVLRGAEVLRRMKDPDVREKAIKAVLTVLSALPDDHGAELANDYTHHPPKSLDLTEDERKNIAGAGLPLAEQVVLRRY